MRDISNFGNNLRDEIIEYRLEHETGYTIKIKFVDHDDKTTARLCLYSKTGEFLSETDEFPFDPAGQRAIDSVKLIKGSSEGREAEYEIKVLFRGGKDPIYCPVDDILTTLRKELSNKITIDLDNSGEDESSVITSKIYSDFSKDKNEEPLKLSESHIRLDDIKMTAQNISMIADAESEEAKPTQTPVFVADVKDKKVTVYDLDVKNNININKAKIDALDVTGDITVGHRLETKGLETKGSADFRSDVSVNGTLMTTSLAAANNTLSVNDSYVSIIGNTSIDGDITLTNSEREVSLTNDDFTINLMGNSDASVTNKKYVNDLVKTERERATNAENDISSSLDAKTTELRSAIEQEISDREEAVATEKDRAETKENDLDERLTAEITRAKEEEKKISDSLITEITRATDAESTLTANLEAEVTRATNKENELNAAIAAEITRAEGAESTVSNNIQAEFNRADAAEKANATAISTEKTRAEAAEIELSRRLDTIEGEGEGSIKSAVNAEKSRAIGVEDEIKTSIDTTNSNLEEAKKDLNKLITDEKNRAIGEETKLSNSISSLSNSLSNEIRDRESAITKEFSDRTAAINAVSESLSKEVTDREEAITQEHDRAVEAEGQLQTSLAAEITRATKAEEAIKADLVNYAKSLELAGGKDTDYVYTFTLKDSSGKKLSEKSIDLPIESVVVSGRYDADTKNVILTLDSGGEISFSVSDLIDGLVSDATFNNHVNNTNNPHGVTAAQVGLGNVTNVRTESVIKENSKNNVTSGAVYSHTSNKNNPHAVTKAQVGLGNVDNTSDINKPISNAMQTALDKKVDKEAGKSLILDTEITRLADMSDGANKVEASTTNGKILIDGNEVSVYVEAEYVVHDKDYHHVSVSASEGVTSNNVTYKYDDTALSNSIEAAKTDISELKTRLNSLDDVIISKLVRLVSNLNDNQIDALVAFAQSLKVENVE